MKTKTPFNSGKGGHGRKGPHAGKGPRGKKTGHKDRSGRRPAPEPLIEQPIADSSDTVPCRICGHPVDPQRMHPHMVRFHGVPIRARGAWAESSPPNTGKGS
ncbi:MAG: hypothetical protein ACOYOU_21850 [Kiritimatiellia bacterium]